MVAETLRRLVAQSTEAVPFDSRYVWVRVFDPAHKHWLPGLCWTSGAKASAKLLWFKDSGPRGYRLEQPTATGNWRPSILSVRQFNVLWELYKVHGDI
jgi:hypothetical protein